MSEAQDLGKTSTGLDPKVSGLLCYLVGVVSGIVFFVLEKENKFVRFHALQSIFSFVGFFVINLVLAFVPVINIALPLVSLAELALWIILMVKAYQGEKFKLPVIGDMAEKQA